MTIADVEVNKLLNEMGKEKMTERQFEEQLKIMRFELKKDFDGVNAVTVTRGTENIADIYGDGRITTCFMKFTELTVEEKQKLTSLISEYACGIMDSQ